MNPLAKKRWFFDILWTQGSMFQELTKTSTKHQTHMEEPSIVNWTEQIV